MTCYTSKGALKQHDTCAHGSYSSYLELCMLASIYPLVCAILGLRLFHCKFMYIAGIPIQLSGALRFFCIQPLGIVVEDVASSVHHSLSPIPTTYSLTVAKHCSRSVWVGLWMAWTAPGYLYPILEKGGSGKTGVVPVSIIGHTKSALGYI